MRKLIVSTVFLAACAAKPTPGTTATPMVSPQVAPASAAIPAAVAAASRTPGNVARDAYRHPAETLEFFGVQPHFTVVELWPGRGWFTEILAPLVRERGMLAAVVPTGDYLQPYRDFLQSNPAVYDKVQVVEVTPPENLIFGPDSSADAALTFRNLHGWVEHGYVAQVFDAAFRVLRPGGVLGLEEHRANPGTPPEASAKSGYISEEAAIAYATKAGFVLEERSEINANPKDTKDYPDGVWSLPPTLKGGDVEKDKYLAIGESDRMTLRFRKPRK